MVQTLFELVYEGFKLTLINPDLYMTINLVAAIAAYVLVKIFGKSQKTTKKKKRK